MKGGPDGRRAGRKMAQKEDVLGSRQKAAHTEGDLYGRWPGQKVARTEGVGKQRYFSPTLFMQRKWVFDRIIFSGKHSISASWTNPSLENLR